MSSEEKVVITFSLNVTVTILVGVIMNRYITP